MRKNQIINSDCIEGLKTLPDESIDCCVTSPPYFGLRDYGHEGQIGLEETPEAFVAKMVEVFTEVKRVLKKEGTLWLNLGDSYAGYHGNKNYSLGEATPSDKPCYRENLRKSMSVKKRAAAITDRSLPLKPKDLIGIPWMVAFALRSSGWYLRQDIIWHKPNPMPESVTDRCTKSHEYIFLLSKSPKYYYDHEAIKQPFLETSVQRLSQDVENQKGSDRVPGKTNGAMKAVGHKNLMNKGLTPHTMHKNRMNGREVNGTLKGGANKRSVWTVTTKPFSEAHFATFPEDLIVDCIKAGCPENGIILDPFMGAGTTAIVSSKLNRDFIGFELNPQYIEIAKKRMQNELGMFNKLAS
jgi:DNA modification methylase